MLVIAHGTVWIQPPSTVQAIFSWRPFFPGHLVDHVIGRVNFGAWFARIHSQQDVRLLAEVENVTANRESCTKALGVAESPLGRQFERS